MTIGTIQPFFDPQWRDWHKLWSMRITALMWLLSGAFMFWPALASYVSLRVFAAGCFGLCIAIGIARLKNQPGIIL